MTSALHDYLVIGAILFAIGALGFLTRRNLIILFLSAELMLQGVALNLVAFGRYWGNYRGQSFTVFVLTVSACEAALALALIIALHQQRHSLDVALWSELGEVPPGESPKSEPPAPSSESAPPTLPRLTPAGHEPKLRAREVSHV